MPISNGQYVAPTWNDNSPPAINAAELQAMCNTLQNGSVITFQNFTNVPQLQAVYDIPPLSIQRSYLAGASVGNYALFGGGDNTVDAYDESLTRTTPTALSAARNLLAGASVGNYALFGGGATVSNSNVVDAYDESLTRTTPTVLSVARRELAGASVGNYALFGGGESSDYSNTVDAYDESLTRTKPTALSVARSSLAGASVGNYALFGGGTTGSNSDVVDAYNESLTRTKPTALYKTSNQLGGASNANYAIFGGGTSSYASAYDSSLTRTQITDKGSVSTVGASSEAYAVFGGGGNSTNNASPYVYSYDDSLTLSIEENLPINVYALAAATVNNIIIFAGGNTGIYRTATATAYVPDNGFYIEVPQFSRFYFQNITSEEEIAISPKTVVGSQPANGYVKFGNIVLSGTYPQS